MGSVCTVVSQSEPGKYGELYDSITTYQPNTTHHAVVDSLERGERNRCNRNEVVSVVERCTRPWDGNEGSRVSTERYGILTDTHIIHLLVLPYPHFSHNHINITAPLNPCTCMLHIGLTI